MNFFRQTRLLLTVIALAAGFLLVSCSESKAEKCEREAREAYEQLQKIFPGQETEDGFDILYEACLKAEK